MKTVIDLFSGIGGFALGLESTGYFKTVQFVENETWCQKILNKNFPEIPIHDDVKTFKGYGADVVVGGFPCQDYSVATTLHNSKGLKGKKGVLWWAIYKILEEKKNPPKYLFLENVDRLLKSPASQRGRDFAVMLQSLNKLGYAVEWRVINAADYGMPQRRRRIFFLAYHKSTNIYKRILKSKTQDWLYSKGTIASAFPIEKIDQLREVKIEGDLVQITNEFNKDGKLSPFLNSGLFYKGKVFTCKTIPKYNGKSIVLKDILQNGEVSEEFFIKDKDLKNPKTNKNIISSVTLTKS